jgi:class 3 adenylate cyclase
LGQRGAAADFAALLNRFYTTAAQTLLRHDAVIDKLIGDEVMAFFVRGISGPRYRRRAVLAGMELLKAVGCGSDEGPWLGGRHIAAIDAGGESTQTQPRFRQARKNEHDGQQIPRSGYPARSEMHP